MKPSPQRHVPLDASSPVQAQRGDLEQSLALFEQMSSRLGSSYSLLENRVNELTGQLAQVSEQRVQELNEKERLAHRLQSLLDLLPGGVVVILSLIHI